MEPQNSMNLIEQADQGLWIVAIEGGRSSVPCHDGELNGIYWFDHKTKNILPPLRLVEKVVADKKLTPPISPTPFDCIPPMKSDADLHLLHSRFLSNHSYR